MQDQKVLLVLVIISAIALVGVVLWRAIYTTKHKGDEKALNAITKAQAASTWTLWLWLIIGEGLSTFLFKDGSGFSLNRIGTCIFILLGIQCLVELFAGYYYTKIAKA
ncbi:hypothetical protein [Butyrivibrio sp. INlla21]|uniref:hypothetical protein n=1 Tax=Butyrivibrio sp. INlla21 TaxID=1520811 RepID=UPI0008F397E2|nr:hypothetical protein [Butyrivibrio sp. INlla21]SFU96298.1 hypothetical protein SAMN02910342_02623 [Butyrivibrio sp. INlla21]